MSKIYNYRRYIVIEEYTVIEEYIVIEDLFTVTIHSSIGYTPYEIQYDQSPQFKIKQQLEKFPPPEEDDRPHITY